MVDFPQTDEEILLVQHFWANLIKRPNGCWEWMGGLGQGRTPDIGKYKLSYSLGTRNARVIALMLSGKSPSPRFCEESWRCCNPAHLSQTRNNSRNTPRINGKFVTKEAYNKWLISRQNSQPPEQKQP